MCQTGHFSAGRSQLAQLWSTTARPSWETQSEVHRCLQRRCHVTSGPSTTFCLHCDSCFTSTSGPNRVTQPCFPCGLSGVEIPIAGPQEWGNPVLWILELGSHCPLRRPGRSWSLGIWIPPSTSKDCDSVSPPLNFQRAQMSHLLHTLHPGFPASPVLPTCRATRISRSECLNRISPALWGGFSISVLTEAPCSPFCLLTSPS